MTLTEYLHYLQRRRERTEHISSNLVMNSLSDFARGQANVLYQIERDLECFIQTGFFPQHREMEEAA